MRSCFLATFAMLLTFSPRAAAEIKLICHAAASEE